MDAMAAICIPGGTKVASSVFENEALNLAHLNGIRETLKRMEARNKNLTNDFILLKVLKLLNDAWSSAAQICFPVAAAQHF